MWKEAANDLILGTFPALPGESYDIHEKCQALLQSGNLPNTVQNYEHKPVSSLLCFEWDKINVIVNCLK